MWHDELYDDERKQTGRDKHVLFPITIDEFIFTHWQHPRKTDVLAKVVGDFRGWKRSPTKYDAAFQKLLKSLQAEDPAGW